MTNFICKSSVTITHRSTTFGVDVDCDYDDDRQDVKIEICPNKKTEAAK